MNAKVNGTKQLLMVVINNYPRPIMADNKVPAASATCLHCHNPNRYIGDKLIVERLTATTRRTPRHNPSCLMHVGGRDGFGHLSGIHGAHLGHIEYIATDTKHQTIPWVSKTNDDGRSPSSLDTKEPVTGQKRVMDCIDCHNRRRTPSTAEEALNRYMAQGSPDPALPFVHKEGLTLIKATYTSQEEARAKITAGLEDYYHSQYPAVWSGQRATNRSGREDARNNLRHKCFSLHEGHLGHAS